MLQGTTLGNFGKKNGFDLKNNTTWLEVCSVANEGTCYSFVLSNIHSLSCRFNILLQIILLLIRLLSECCASVELKNSNSVISGTSKEFCHLGVLPQRPFSVSHKRFWVPNLLWSIWAWRRCYAERMSPYFLQVRHNFISFKVYPIDYVNVTKIPS